jgi:hypothetical protein
MTVTVPIELATFAVDTTELLPHFPRPVCEKRRELRSGLLRALTLRSGRDARVRVESERELSRNRGQLQGLERRHRVPQRSYVLELARRVSEAAPGEQALAVVDGEVLFEGAIEAPGQELPPVIGRAVARIVVVTVPVAIEVGDDGARRQVSQEPVQIERGGRGGEQLLQRARGTLGE